MLNIGTLQRTLRLGTPAIGERPLGRFIRSRECNQHSRQPSRDSLSEVGIPKGVFFFPLLRDLIAFLRLCQSSLIFMITVTTALKVPAMNMEASGDAPSLDY